MNKQRLAGVPVSRDKRLIVYSTQATVPAFVGVKVEAARRPVLLVIIILYTLGRYVPEGVYQLR